MIVFFCCFCVFLLLVSAQNDSTTMITTSTMATNTTTTGTSVGSTSVSVTANSSASTAPTKASNSSEPDWVRTLRSQVGKVSPSAAWIHDTPRSSITGVKGRNEPFGPESDGPYFEPFVSVLVFCGVVGTLFVAGGVVFCVARYVCDCCGGDEPAPQGYSKCGILLPQISLLVLSLLLIVIGFLGIYGTVLWNGALDGVPADIARRGTIEGDAIASTIARVRAIDASPKPYDCGDFCNRTIKFGDFLDTYAKSGKTVKDNAVSGESVFNNANIAREALFGTYLFLLLVSVICALVAASCKIPRAATGAAACSFLAICFAWFTIGISFSLAIGAADWCFFDTTALIKQGPQAMIANDSAITAANKQLDIGGIFGGANNGAGNGTRQVIEFMLDDAVRLAYIANVNGTHSTTEIARLRNEDAELRALQTNVSLQRAAVWVIDVFAAHKDKACGDALDANIYISATAIVVIILLLPFIVCAFVAEKRFAADDDFSYHERATYDRDDNYF
jgi:hypothetical protein